ncbi:helix-turn-helix domain-containing protein [uncultured Aquimarina sp.]|uniref:helix-turn-helix domain-containing protein n=1 Tax=uncultured Aquimarina sp. TaxID=575652 RepID=UPI00260C3183|nr:helix-turn-helix domain-containing protein [uncultured Aquimarina sp.]
MSFFVNRYTRRCIFYWMLLSTFWLSAQKEEIIGIDTIQNKSIDQLVDLIKSSRKKKAAVYENILKSKNLSGNDLSEIYIDIGYSFYKREESEISISYFQKAIDVAKSNSDNETLANAYLKLGNSYLQDWQNQNALDTYHQVLQMAQERGNLKKEIVAKSNIVIVLRRMNQLDKALEDCRGLLSFIDKTSYKNKKNHVNVLTIISEVYLDLGQFDSVLKYADIGIAISTPLNYEIGIADLYTKKGIVFFKRNDYDQALSFLYKAEKILNKLKVNDRSNQRINVNYFLASYFYDMQSYEKAVDYLLKTINALKENDLRKNRVIDAHMLLAKSYKEIGNTDASIVWFSKHQELQDQFQKDKDKTVHKIYDQSTQQLDNKIRKLESEQEKEQKLKSYILWALVIVALSLVFILITYFRKQKANKKVFNKLIQKISDLESKEAQENIETRESTKEIYIDDDKINAVLKGLEKLEKQEYFLSVDCNLRSIAKKVKTNATYLSRIINNYKGKSFNDYINDLRIDYVLKRLKNDNKFRSFSISSIASEIGYKSDNSFTKHFKAKTGLNPSYYIKNIEKLPVKL